MHTSPDTASDIPTVVNTDQAAAWNGPEGANWSATARAPVTDPDVVGPLLAAAAIADGDHVLDVGCGTGDATRRAAVLAGRGSAVGIDLSTLMVGIATEAAADEGLDNAEFVAGDAQVHAFPPARFDVVISHFGAMFFADPAIAFANLARALRPGGRLALVVPQAMASCEWYRAPLAALTGADPTPETHPSLMFSLADPDATTGLLVDAGFAGVWMQPRHDRLWFGADVATAAGFFAGSGPVRALLESDPTLDEARARAVLSVALRPYLADDGVRIGGDHWLVTATRAEAAG